MSLAASSSCFVEAEGVGMCSHPVQPARRAACLLLGAATVVTSVGASSLAAGQGPGKPAWLSLLAALSCTCWRFLWARVPKHCGGEMGPGLRCEFLSREVVRAEGSLPTHHRLQTRPTDHGPSPVLLVGQSAQGLSGRRGGQVTGLTHPQSVTDFPAAWRPFVPVLPALIFSKALLEKFQAWVGEWKGRVSAG